MLKTLSAASCLRNGRRRASSFLPFETSRKGRNSPPESLHQKIWEKSLFTFKTQTFVDWLNNESWRQEYTRNHFLQAWWCVYNSQRIMVLQLGVDVLYFPLRLLHRPLFFCFRQDCGFLPAPLLDLQHTFKQLQYTTGVSFLEYMVKRHPPASKK